MTYAEMANAPVPLEQVFDERCFGGKSAQLGASLRAGLPVPPGWALSVSFVEAVIHRSGAALETLETFLHDKHGPFAVRSSGVGEDAKIASFAGQHFTELNRVGFEDIVQAIHIVWESGHAESARAYRAKLNVTEPPQTAVTLQQMIFPECAGVMFTCDPVKGDDEILIEASWGLGEAVVEGVVIPDRYRFSKTGALLEKHAGTKDVYFKPLPGGGTEETPIDDPKRIHAFCLADEQLSKLVRLAVQCEAHFGPGRDIEWGFEKGELYLLQCRSITTGRTG